jgi:hypothetical protein
MHPKGGHLRAAIVAIVKPRLVADYTDKFDCAAMFQMFLIQPSKTGIMREEWCEVA